MYSGYGQGGKGSSRTLFRVPDSSASSRPGPYSWPPESAKEPDLENHAFYVLFSPFSDSFIPDPLPLAPLFADSWKNMVSKGIQLYRLLRLLLETSKMGLRVGFQHENWPILWHI